MQGATTHDHFIKTLPKEKFLAELIVKVDPKSYLDEKKVWVWLKQVYVKRLGGFSHLSLSLLIYNFMYACIAIAIKDQVKQTNFELAVIVVGLTKGLQARDNSINKSFKAKLSAAL